jgi:hypothetical protein
VRVCKNEFVRISNCELIVLYSSFVSRFSCRSSHQWLGVLLSFDSRTMEQRLFNVQFLEAADAKRILDGLLELNINVMCKDDGWKLLDALNQVTAMRMIGCITVEEIYTLYPKDKWVSMEEFVKTINAKKRELKKVVTS